MRTKGVDSYSALCFGRKKDSFLHSEGATCVLLRRQLILDTVDTQEIGQQSSSWFVVCYQEWICHLGSVLVPLPMPLGLNKCER